MFKFLSLIAATWSLLLASDLAPAGGTESKEKVLARQWYEAFDSNNPAFFDQVLADTWTDIPSPASQAPGPAGAKAVLRELQAAFPDFRIHVEDVLQEGNKVVVRSTLSGTQSLAFAGIAPKGRALKIQAVDIHEFSNGRIARTWHTEDWMTGLRQLGAFDSAPK